MNDPIFKSNARGLPGVGGGGEVKFRFDRRIRLWKETVIISWRYISRSTLVNNEEASYDTKIVPLLICTSRILTDVFEFAEQQINKDDHF